MQNILPPPYFFLSEGPRKKFIYIDINYMLKPNFETRKLNLVHKCQFSYNTCILDNNIHLKCQGTISDYRVLKCQLYQSVLNHFRQIKKDKSRAYKQAFETSNSAQIALFKNVK